MHRPQKAEVQTAKGREYKAENTAYEQPFAMDKLYARRIGSVCAQLILKNQYCL